VTSANRVPYLQTRKVDLVISSLGVTPDRAKSMAFSEPYAPYFSGVFGHGDVKVATPPDLSGKTIGVARGTLDDLSLTKLAPADAVIKRFDDQAATAQAVVSGQVQLIASGNVAIAALNKDNPGQPLDQKFIMKQSPCSIGLRRGEPDLLQWVNAAIYAHKLDGSLDDLSVKWFGAKLPEFPVL
jgi:polar amino acid transport system substrate-binding protein